jgi:multicomponent Na+:H+ antiporter subunit E
MPSRLPANATPASPALAAAAPARGARWRALAWRTLPLALLWALLSGGSAASWVVGVPAVLAAAWLMPAPPPRRWRLRAAGVPGFVVFFVRESWRGGVDVAARVLAPRLRVQPGLVWHRWELPAEGPARTLFVLCASLLPGTLVAGQHADGVRVHALDTGAAVSAELVALERAIAGFIVALPSPPAPSAPSAPSAPAAVPLADG